MTDRAAIRQRFLVLDCATICDVFDTMGLPEPALDAAIQRVTTPRAKAAGWAYTIEGAFTVAAGPDRLKLQIADGLPEDSLAVWGGTNARGICLFGDLISLTMFKRGCRGAVVDGGVRDIDAISDLDFPVFARYRSPVQSIGRWRVVRHDIAISVPGALGRLVPVHPGDFVLADSDGVVVIPQAHVLEVLERAEDVVRKEVEARELGSGGLTAEQMLDRYGHV
jgi:4-hydroxy-4-methyl-2-oxoglutarate aldolase